MQQQTERPKRPPRRPGPLPRLFDELKAEVKKADSTEESPPARRQLHEGRAAAWADEYAQTGARDARILSLAFAAVAGPTAEARYTLLRLAAAALAEAGRLDGTL
ncbi:hypothetical protein [Streptomyces sp. NPDC047097]|uniref:hypothetical protein n=1 Tax=Streptomyces sp. NPDC047097 TaxID=3155260 RepID=UPI0033D76281